MAAYEYRVVPAPAKGAKAKGLKAPEDRFAHALEQLMNRMGAEGWEYQRSETLPSTERKGLMGSTTNWRHVLIFRRALPEQVRQAEPAAGWPVPAAEIPPEPVAAATPVAQPPEDERPPRPTLVATRKDPVDSGI